MGLNSTDARIAWFGTHAGIPSGFTRDTTFDDSVYIQVADSDYTGPSTTSGAHSHDEADPKHDHPGSPTHTHTFSAAAASGEQKTQVKTTLIGGEGDFAADNNHVHTAATSSAGSVTYSAATDLNIENTTPEPEYASLIVLQPDNADYDIPVNGACFLNSTTIPTGFAKIDAAFEDKFPRGAATAGDGGGTGGSPNHAHDDTTGHVHAGSHNHAYAPSSATFFVGYTQDIGGTACRDQQPHHNVRLAIKATETDPTTLTVDVASCVPEYIKLIGVKNSNGVPTTPIGAVVMFIGAYGSIPSNWSPVTAAYNRMLRLTVEDGEVNETSGDNSHTHTITAPHAHTGDTHNHSVQLAWIGGTEYAEAPGLKDDWNYSLEKNPNVPHGHTWTVGTTAPTVAVDTVTLASADGRPTRRSVLLIKKASYVEKRATLGTLHGMERLVLVA